MKLDHQKVSFVPDSQGLLLPFPRVSLGPLFFSKFPFSPPAIPFIIESCVEMKIDSRSKISNRLQSWHKKDKRG